MKHFIFLLFALLGIGTVVAQNKAVVNGIPWYDDKGNIVNAHGACIVEENGRYYLLVSGSLIRAMPSLGSLVIHRMTS